MDSFFDDDFFNKKVLNKIKKEIKQNQIASTVKELSAFIDKRELYLKSDFILKNKKRKINSKLTEGFKRLLNM